ncbi:MAG: peptidase [Cycloclasticus sp. symbiont of Poecilosclerida sp. M]|nr:MAG: peptidase [Cycloclasticus sp. symbiont of Poecilosclerida sp. M]
MKEGASIVVDIKAQTLRLYAGQNCTKVYPVSTAKNGTGQTFGSECTPLGRHKVRAMIGAEARLGSVFVGRRETGEIYSEQLAQAQPERDWILTRIMWLSGLEVAKNRLGPVDTMRRFIYIHGAPDNMIEGVADSHGCIRMQNADVIDLFQRVSVQTPVNIVDE